MVWVWEKKIIPTLYVKKISNLTPYQIYFPKWPTFCFCSLFFCRFPHSRHLKRREWTPSLTHVCAWQVLQVWLSFFFFEFFFHSRRLKWRDWIFDFFFGFCFFGQHMYIRIIINYQLFILGQFLLVWPVCRHNLHCLGVGVLSTTSSSISVLMWVLLGRPFFSLRMFGLWQSMRPSYGGQ